MRMRARMERTDVQTAPVLLFSVETKYRRLKANFRAVDVPTLLLHTHAHTRHTHTLVHAHLDAAGPFKTLLPHLHCDLLTQQCPNRPLPSL